MEIGTIYDVVDVLLDHEKRLNALENKVAELTKQVSDLTISVGRLEGRLMVDET